MLKMTLNKIRGQIQIYPENWVNLYETNCYAYALGLDIKESQICSRAYQPGNISGTSDLDRFKEYFLYSDLIIGLEKDLEALSISYREIEPTEQIKSDEWKIALMVENYNKNIFDGSLFNFHFLRTNKNGIWTHKSSYLGPISKKDNLNQIIIDPRECDLFSYEYKKCYALSLNKDKK